MRCDWLRMVEVSMKNQQRRSKHPSLQQWLSSSRLNSKFHSAASIKPEETGKIALMQRYRHAIKPTVARLSQLIATLARATTMASTARSMHLQNSCCFIDAGRQLPAQVGRSAVAQVQFKLCKSVTRNPTLPNTRFRCKGDVH